MRTAFPRVPLERHPAIHNFWLRAVRQRQRRRDRQDEGLDFRVNVAFGEGICGEVEGF